MAEAHTHSQQRCTRSGEHTVLAERAGDSGTHVRAGTCGMWSSRGASLTRGWEGTCVRSSPLGSRKETPGPNPAAPEAHSEANAALGTPEGHLTLWGAEPGSDVVWLRAGLDTPHPPEPLRRQGPTAHPVAGREPRAASTLGNAVLLTGGNPYVPTPVTLSTNLGCGGRTDSDPPARRWLEGGCGSRLRNVGSWKHQTWQCVRKPEGGYANQEERMQMTQVGQPPLQPGPAQRSACRPVR